MTATEKWTEIEHLPEWDEEFYHVYTAKKHGHWLMLKTLRPELKNQPHYEEMIEKEFEVRYNLAHPNIIMINDFEEVPGVGMCIITDDVYGDSLSKIIKEGKVTSTHIHKLTHELLDAIDYIQVNHLAHHPIKPSRIIFTENIGNLKLIDVGFDQRAFLTHDDTSDDIRAFGQVLTEALDALPADADIDSHRIAKLRRVAARCLSDDPKRRYTSLDALRADLADNRRTKFLMGVIVFLLLMIALLLWLLSSARPPLPVS